MRSPDIAVEEIQKINHYTFPLKTKSPEGRVSAAPEPNHKSLKALSFCLRDPTDHDTVITPSALKSMRLSRVGVSLHPLLN